MRNKHQPNWERGQIKEYFRERERNTYRNMEALQNMVNCKQIAVVEYRLSCFTARGIFLDQKSIEPTSLTVARDSHPLCQQGSPLCVHIFNVPNCIAFSCLPLALSKVATGLHRYSLYHLSICAPRERHRLMTFAHRIMLQNPHACSLRDWSDISSSFIPRNGTSGP